MTDAKPEIENVSGNPLFDYAADLVESEGLFQAVGREFGFAAPQDRLQKSHFAANARNSSDQLVNLVVKTAARPLSAVSANRT